MQEGGKKTKKIRGTATPFLRQKFTYLYGSVQQTTCNAAITFRVNVELNMDMGNLKFPTLYNCMILGNCI